MPRPCGRRRRREGESADTDGVTSNLQRQHWTPTPRPKARHHIAVTVVGVIEIIVALGLGLPYLMVLFMMAMCEDGGTPASCRPLYLSWFGLGGSLAMLLASGILLTVIAERPTHRIRNLSLCALLAVPVAVFLPLGLTMLSAS